MKQTVSGRSGERLFTLAAFALAVASGGFGGWMVVRLESMENPPIMMGLDFSSLREEEAVDPIETGTIGNRRRTGGVVPEAKAIPRAPQNLDFRLLSVIDGVAFIEVHGPEGRALWPVDVGATLPGAGQVVAIERDAGRWRIRTNVMTITGEPQ
jgi:hypothetical protein